MPRRRDEPWWLHAPSTPLAVEGGLATSRQRGPMADTWWSKRFVEVLESYGLGGRMQRGRRYARAGQVVSLDVRPAVVTAQVQGSRAKPYRVFLELPEPTEQQWAAIDAAMATKVGFGAQLLAGEVPHELEEVFRATGVELLPRRWTDLRTECTCPDWGDPCKHVAAVLYVLADQLDADPWLLLEWRGRTREQVLAPFQGGAASEAEAVEIAPWWPFGPGALPAFEEVPDDDTLDVELDLAPPGQVLERLTGTDIEVGGRALADVLQPAYEQLNDGGLAPPAAPAERPTPPLPRPSRRARR
jgi:uncharacterized Zn finger protein